MKKFTLLLVSVIAFSCGGPAAEEPKRLLSEDEMVNIIYDINMIQSMRSFQPQALDDNNVDAKKYIFKKYKIDSLTFAQNNTWYASNIEKYDGILKKVSERVKKEKEVLSPKADTTKVKNTIPKTAEIARAKSRRDSLRKVSVDRIKRQQNEKK